ncbi:MAG: aldehyde ferredoxin oxidoreductase [Deltaproteobacteria bacterium]|jgi:aldehyde:ferredoxin oxidoreductase|nr:aldehyde ferredoxin oxidoreductase [Deltaproteobacteria bacterium]
MAVKYGGWAGRTLRVDLSTGAISKESTIERHMDVLGGTGIGYKVLWEETGAGLKPFDPANKIIFAVGPLAGTSAPCSGRTAITTIFPTCWPTPLTASGHMGGNFAAKLKYAGFDAVIIEGRADKPVWLHIRDGGAQLRDARHIWGQGIARTDQEISREIGADCSVAAIGQAGEKLVPMSVIINAKSHSAGGVGAVMGSKNLKAIAVQGSRPVHIAADKGKWEDLVNLHLRLLGANNQHVTPSFPSPGSEYYNPRSRWIGAPGKRWGAADPPVRLTDDIYSLNRIAFRTNSAAFFLGDGAWRYTVRGNGCHSCPIRCHTIIKDPGVAAKYGIREIAQNTCAGMNFGRGFFPSLLTDRGDAAREACMMGMHLADDLGVWCNYGQLQRDFLRLRQEGVFKAKLGADEYASIPWKQCDAGDPLFLMDILPRIAEKRGEFGAVLGLGTGYMLEKWGLDEKSWGASLAVAYWKMGHPKHHANEDDGQCGVIINTQYNRDAQCHSHCNFVRNGLPIREQKRLAANIWGSPDAVDAVGEYTPVNIHKMKRAKWSLLRKELHDSLSLCNWMGPWVASPLKERGYAGDDTLESQLYSLATGHSLSRDELDLVAERIFTLHRALTIRGMNELNMREKHDQCPDWIYADAGDKPAFSKGTIRMDKADIQSGFDIFYRLMGWDTATGAPTRETYAKLGLEKAAAELDAKKLLPKS